MSKYRTPSPEGLRLRRAFYAADTREKVKAVLKDQHDSAVSMLPPSVVKSILEIDPDVTNRANVSAAIELVIQDGDAPEALVWATVRNIANSQLND